ncbi:hypothetical protein [Streptosporangium sp. CA-115845]|uniref:hypothetical protein n=1 Tax=Streptosporangium sp. CA-115845 TaxID=3240071 RepID=UPI003D8DE867
MPDQIHLRFGALPWNPADNATVLEVFDQHDRPTCGLLEQGGQRYIFDCVEGHAWDINVWAYAPVTAAQVAGLRATDGEEFAARVDAVLRSGVITAALAVGDRLELIEIVDSSAISGDVYAGIMDAVLAKIERGRSTAESLRKVQVAG